MRTVQYPLFFLAVCIGFFFFFTEEVEVQSIFTLLGEFQVLDSLDFTSRTHNFYSCA